MERVIAFTRQGNFYVATIATMVAHHISQRKQTFHHSLAIADIEAMLAKEDIDTSLLAEHIVRRPYHRRAPNV